MTDGNPTPSAFGLRRRRDPMDISPLTKGENFEVHGYLDLTGAKHQRESPSNSPPTDAPASERRGARRAGWSCSDKDPESPLYCAGDRSHPLRSLAMTQ